MERLRENKAFGRAYLKYGAKFVSDGKAVRFTVYAPHADTVSVVGDFNDWDPAKNVMQKQGTDFTLTVPGLKVYDNYKYCVTHGGRSVLKADPYAFHAETAPETASKIYDLSGFLWEDEAYFKALKQNPPYHRPMNIYEVHLGSFRKKANGDPYSYRELAKILPDYVVKMGYTHIELLPVSEFPFDGSWGYQVTGYFAVTSRFGTPHDFMYFINECHKKGIGVILDWVPAHFPKDEFGLYEFDGTPLYESGRADLREHKSWGTMRFDYGNPYVCDFLTSSAMFYFENYHIDGIRVDAVASMLYLDYDKKPGEWVPNRYGDNKNLEAIEFLKALNETVFSAYPYALMIAEESTAFPSVTKPTYLGGLGFNFKWNMGWMNDMLSYMETDPLFRKGVHNKLTFSMCYAFSENFVLPLSHDEVVHGKRSLLDKMPGSYEDKFASLRAFYAFMAAHPGKKLLFMGGEFGQFKEWNYKEGLEFFLTRYEKHKKLQTYVRDLNFFYKDNPPMYEIDDSWQGFTWLIVDDADSNAVAFERTDYAGDKVIAVISFSGSTRKDYWIKTGKGKFSVVLNSDAKKYGGSGILKKRSFTAKKKSDGNYYISVDLPPLTALYLKKILKTKE